MPFRFRLVDEQGNDLGPFATRQGDWRQGERLSRWHGERFEIVEVVDSGDESVHAYLVVREVFNPSSRRNT